MVCLFLIRNSNSMAVAVNDKIPSNFINGYYTFIITNLNRIAVLCSVDCRIKRRILLTANFRGKRFCRSRVRRAAVFFVCKKMNFQAHGKMI